MPDDYFAATPLRAPGQNMSLQHRIIEFYWLNNVLAAFAHKEIFQVKTICFTVTIIAQKQHSFNVWAGMLYLEMRLSSKRKSSIPILNN